METLKAADPLYGNMKKSNAGLVSTLHFYKQVAQNKKKYSNGFLDDWIGPKTPDEVGKY